MTPARLRILCYAVVSAVLVFLGVSIYRSRHQRAIEDAAHARTVSDSTVAAHADTIFAHDTLRVGEVRTSYRTLRDTVRLHLTDTVLVARTLDRADTVIVHDSIALADAGRALTTGQQVQRDLREELRLAQLPHPAPRFSGVAQALYDPFRATPTASATLALRIAGRVSLVARGDQRFAPGERPRGAVGVQLAF